MRISLTVFCAVLLCCLTRSNLFGQAGFTAPATVVVNTPVTVTNTSVGGSSFFWSFCSGSLYNPPQITNLGHITGMDAPVFIATAKEGNDYYAFFTNNSTPSANLYRLYFGTSLLNTPTVTNMGNFGGVIPINTEGVQVVADADGWHVLVVGGNPAVSSSIAKVDFGVSLSNPAPTAVDWGNIGNLSYPHDLFITKENNQWYGFTVNAYNNTVTRFDFGTSFQNPPVGTNLGNLGNLNYPDGIFAVQESGNWYVFITNRLNNNISRLDFGNALANTPTGVDLGNPGGMLDYPRDLSIIHDCGKIFGLVVNERNDDLVRIDFNGGITGTLSGVSLGSGGGLDFPHSISTLFRENNSLYAFIVNAANNTLSRVEFNGCTNASQPTSTLQQPPAFSYNTPGTYTVNLIVDEGLPTQSAFCKNIVVTPVPAIASFTAPDTVCVNTPVTINNTTTGGSTYYWNFCSGSMYNPPQMTSLGQIAGMDVPVFIATAKDGNDYYAFITNNTSRNLLRLYFGNSLLNTPVVTNLGTFGGIIPITTEGVQVVKDGNGWHVLVVGGTAAQSKIVKVDFGASLGNAAPTAVDWGNIGNLDYPVDLYLFQESSHWYGFTVNFFNNTVTRFDFGTSFQNPPVGTNLGNLGNLGRPAGIFAMQESGNWHVFITNQESSTLTRLDFGNSLLNTPAGTNLGNPGGVLHQPRDLSIIHDCGKIFGLVVNETTDDLVRIDFQGDITSALSGISLGSGGGLDFPHSISTLFREGNSLYAFITNAFNNTLSRLVFDGCNNASIPSSLLQQPPAVSYNTPGIYNINLLVDEALPTQSTFCKTVVVLPPPVVNLGADTTLCVGTTLDLDAGAGFSWYQWNTGAATQEITVTLSGTYTVEVSNGGCTTQDAIQVNMNPAMQLNAAVTDIDCNQPGGSITLNATGGTQPYRYYMNGTGPATNNIFANLPVGNYTMRVQDQAGCEVSQIFNVKVDVNKIITTSANVLPPSCNGLQDGTIDVQVQAGIPPFEFAIKGQPYQTTPTFNNLAAGTYTVYTRNGVCLDSLLLTLNAPAVIDLQYTKDDELCSRSNGNVAVTVAGGTPPYDLYWNSVYTPVQTLDDLSAGSYNLEVTDARGCNTATVIVINNITPPPVRILNNDITINIGETIQLVAVNAPDYLWTPAAGLSCVNCATPLARPLQPTSYIVTTVTGKNCVPADTVNINLSYDLSLYVPNAFTPNSDGKNDLFRAKTKGIARYQLQVFNRWGQLLFETADVAKGWDGMFKNALQPYGTYVYVIQYAYFGKEAETLLQKGTFTLIR